MKISVTQREIDDALAWWRYVRQVSEQDAEEGWPRFCPIARAARNAGLCGVLVENNQLRCEIAEQPMWTMLPKAAVTFIHDMDTAAIFSDDALAAPIPTPFSFEI